MEKKRIGLLGATGMVGGAAVRYCLDHVGISAVTVIGRRSCRVRHDKLTEFLHPDLADSFAISRRASRKTPHESAEHHAARATARESASLRRGSSVGLATISIIPAA